MNTVLNTEDITLDKIEDIFSSLKENIKKEECLEMSLFQIKSLINNNSQTKKLLIDFMNEILDTFYNLNKDERIKELRN